jgi:diacylglycerol O-acyltransferase / wax synthase
VADTPEKTDNFAHRLTTQDASFVYGESRNGPLHIGALATFEGQISAAEMVQHVEQRLHLIPRYRQRLAFVPLKLAHPTWEDDPDFRIDRHIRAHELPSGSGEAELIDSAMRIYQWPLSLDRPVWETHIFNGLAYGRSAVMWKTHHCLVDGVSGMELLNVILDFRPDAAPPPPPENPWTPAPTPGAARSLVRGIFDLADERLELARQASELIPRTAAIAGVGKAVANAAGVLARMATRPIVAAPWNTGLVSRERSLAWLRCSFEDTRTIRNALRGTVNDVVLAILAEGAARYLKRHRCEIDGRPLRIGCPVNVRRRSESGALGNRVSMMFPEFPAEPMDPVARLESTAQETERRKRGAEPQSLEILLGAADLLPPSLLGVGSAIGTNLLDAAVRLFSKAPRLSQWLAPPAAINFVATNVPGAQVPLFFERHRLIDQIGLVPLGANLGYGVAIVSYNQNLYFGFMAEPHLMPDVELMRDFVRQAFEELKAEASRRVGAAEVAENGAAAAAAAQTIRATEPIGARQPTRAAPA